MKPDKENIERQKAIKILLERWAQKKDTSEKAALLYAKNKKQKPGKVIKEDKFL